MVFAESQEMSGEGVGNWFEGWCGGYCRVGVSWVRIDVCLRLRFMLMLGGVGLRCV